MIDTADIKIGQVVYSLKGRDKGNAQIIVEIIDKKYVYTVDGKTRKLDSPKKKSIKHLQITNTVLDQIVTGEIGKYQYNDAYIRRILEPFTK